MITNLQDNTFLREEFMKTVDANIAAFKLTFFNHNIIQALGNMIMI